MQPEEAANRALPTQSFMSMLSEKAGMPVDAGGVHRALQSQFGADASAKTLKALGMLKDFAAKAKERGGIAGAAGGMFSNLVASAESSGVRPLPPARELVVCGWSQRCSHPRLWHVLFSLCSSSHVPQWADRPAGPSCSVYSARLGVWHAWLLEWS